MKCIKIIGPCCLAVLLIVGIYLTTPSKTLDFRGTVTGIEANEQTTVLYLTLSDTPLSSAKAAYTVTANAKTTVRYCCKDDPAIDLSAIKIGDTIQGNYRPFTKNHTAKFITVDYHN